MDVSQYLEIFIDETKEHLQSLNTQILDLEQDPESEDTINEIFRAAHSLKGMAGTMGYKRMQNLTHDMENVFSEVRNGNIKVGANMIDILFQCLDALEEYLDTIQTTADEGTNENEPLIKALNQILAGSEGEEGDDAPEAEAKDSKAEEAEDGEKDKWTQIVLGTSEKSVIGKAQEEGKNVFGLTVYIQESCILKAARAFLVIKAVEELGEIIVSAPATQDIEDERFGNDFSIIVITDKALEDLTKAAEAVSEIETVAGGSIDLSAETSEPKAVPVAEQKQETAAPVAATGTKVAATPAATKQDKKAVVAKPVVNRTVRVDIEKLDSLMNLVSELIIAKNSLVSRTANNENEVSDIEYLESVTTNLHESVMKVRMVPIESVVQKFPRMIRDLQKKLGKKMELYMSGEETELDRTVVDEIGDPLMHLLRNAADHGLENAELRQERGKPEVGSIHLDAYQDGNNVIIEVSDDGGGIDIDSVKQKAIERGVVTPDQAGSMSDKDVMELLFLPSFSTAKEVTDVSGRGVGLDVVKSKIESLSGEVSVKSKYGEGSTWSIRLPLTLAIIQALMVVVGDEKYAISLGSIETIENITNNDINYVQAKEVINLRGTVIPLIRLDEMLDIREERSTSEDLIVVIVRKGEQRAGLIVDELMGQQEIVIKSLGKYISKCKYISGATILGNGEVALIIDANAMI
ncbi:MAG: chemotaxis protein CheA [Lachnospiraceae bacterium]|jgi:two-component system chemotaxis sensor kinase CheA|nr:chemotaxis protein CheA [Lachnospiraceae bacterium]